MYPFQDKGKKGLNMHLFLLTMTLLMFWLLNQSPFANRLRGKASWGLSKEKESTMALKAKISAPVPHISSEMLQVRTKKCTAPAFYKATFVQKLVQHNPA